MVFEENIGCGYWVTVWCDLPLDVLKEVEGIVKVYSADDDAPPRKMFQFDPRYNIADIEAEVAQLAKQLAK